MDNTTIVLPSARAIRHEQLSQEEATVFLPNYITMSDFIIRLCIVEKYKLIDEDSRVLLLLEASDFSAFSNLQIERNFFTFTKNSSYIFKFFEELSVELYDIENLSRADLYAEYEEHIAILQELYRRYEALCREKNLLDKIFLPKLYRFNEKYAASHESVRIHIEGHLTNFEFSLLEQLKNFTSTTLCISTTAFNTKVQSRFVSLGLELEVGFEYLISLNTLSIISQTPLPKSEYIQCESFSESLLQIAFIKQKVYEFIQKGHSAQNIAVVLPDENAALLLQSFDEKGNFNFAMGSSFCKSEIYTKINAALEAIEQDSQENKSRVNRVGDELIMKFSPIYYKKCNEIDMLSFLYELESHTKNKRELVILHEEIYSFKRILDFVQEMSVRSVLSLFMQRLSSRTIDDIRGGKVTVMGVLETRGVHFDGVIIIDFDEKNVPKRSNKDMFLNTQLRKNANLPTMNDRENLQKHYYKMLINRSCEVAISYVLSKESSGSKFLKQLKIAEKKRYDELEYASLLFQREAKTRVEELEIMEPYSFKDVALSATRLKSFLSCKRHYYHHHIKNVKKHTIPRDMPQEHEIGTSVHTALKELYMKRNSYDDAMLLISDLSRELDDICGKSELEKYLITLQKRRLIPFCHKEIERFKSGWSVFACEASLSTVYGGMKLVGQVDRVDKRGDEFAVLDYKTGNYTLYNKKNFSEATDFQLEFYTLLAQGFGKVSESAFYDLKESLIVPEEFLEEKLELLHSHIETLLTIESVNFSKCEDRSHCTFCEYKIICGRE